MGDRTFVHLSLHRLPQGSFDFDLVRRTRSAAWSAHTTGSDSTSTEPSGNANNNNVGGLTRQLARSVAQIALGPTHIAFLFEDGRVGRAELQPMLGKDDDSKTRTSSSCPPPGNPTSGASSGGGQNASGAPTTTASCTQSVSSAAAAAAVAAAAHHNRTKLRRVMMAATRGRSGSASRGVIVGTRPMIPASAVPENLVAQAQVVLQGRSRELIVRELQRTNLNVNEAVNNLLSRDDDEQDSDSGYIDATYLPEEILSSLLDRGMVPVSAAAGAAAAADGADPFDDQSAIHSVYNGLEVFDYALARGERRVRRTGEESSTKRTESQTTSTKTASDLAAQFGSIAMWTDEESGDFVKATHIGGTFSELVAVCRTTGRLLCWPWKRDTAPSKHEDMLHKKMLNFEWNENEKITILDCSMTRISMCTSDNRLAAIVDPSLGKAAATALDSTSWASVPGLALVSLVRSSNQCTAILAYFNANKSDCDLASGENSAAPSAVDYAAGPQIWWWGIVPFNERRRRWEKQRSLNTGQRKQVKFANNASSAEAQIAARPSEAPLPVTLKPGCKVHTRVAPIYEVGAVAVNTANGHPQVGVLMEPVWTLNETCRFKVLCAEALLHDEPWQLADADASISTNSSGAMAKLGDKRKRAPTPPPSSMMEQAWNISDVAFVHTGKARSVGTVVKVDGPLLGVVFSHSAYPCPPEAGAMEVVGSESTPSPLLADMRLMRCDDVQPVQDNAPRVPIAVEKVPVRCALDSGRAKKIVAMVVESNGLRALTAPGGLHAFLQHQCGSASENRPQLANNVSLIRVAMYGKLMSEHVLPLPTKALYGTMRQPPKLDNYGDEHMLVLRDGNGCVVPLVREACSSSGGGASHAGGFRLCMYGPTLQLPTPVLGIGILPLSGASDSNGPENVLLSHLSSSMPRRHKSNRMAALASVTAPDCTLMQLVLACDVQGVKSWIKKTQSDKNADQCEAEIRLARIDCNRNVLQAAVCCTVPLLNADDVDGKNAGAAGGTESQSSSLSRAKEASTALENMARQHQNQQNQAAPSQNQQSMSDMGAAMLGALQGGVAQGAGGNRAESDQAAATRRFYDRQWENLLSSAAHQQGASARQRRAGQFFDLVSFAAAAGQHHLHQQQFAQAPAESVRRTEQQRTSGGGGGSAGGGGEPAVSAAQQPSSGGGRPASAAGLPASAAGSNEQQQRMQLQQQQQQLQQEQRQAGDNMSVQAQVDAAARQIASSAGQFLAAPPAADNDSNEQSVGSGAPPAAGPPNLSNMSVERYTSEPKARQGNAIEIIKILCSEPLMNEYLVDLLTNVDLEGRTAFTSAIFSRCYTVALVLWDTAMRICKATGDVNNETLMKMIEPPLSESPLLALCQGDTCSFTWTGDQHIKQDIFECKTCGLTGSLCCCTECAYVCHKGHDCKLKRTAPTAYCDCWEKCPCKALVQGNLTARFALLNKLLSETNLVNRLDHNGEHIVLFLARTVGRQSVEHQQYRPPRIRSTASNVLKTAKGNQSGGDADSVPEHELEPPRFAKMAFESVLADWRAVKGMLTLGQTDAQVENDSRLMDEQQFYMASQQGACHVDLFTHALLATCQQDMLSTLLTTLIRELQRRPSERDPLAPAVVGRFVRSLIRVYCVLCSVAPGAAGGILSTAGGPQATTKAAKKEPFGSVSDYVRAKSKRSYAYAFISRMRLALEALLPLVMPELARAADSLCAPLRMGLTPPTAAAHGAAASNAGGHLGAGATGPPSPTGSSASATEGVEAVGTILTRDYAQSVMVHMNSRAARHNVSAPQAPPSHRHSAPSRGVAGGPPSDGAGGERTQWPPQAASRPRGFARRRRHSRQNERNESIDEDDPMQGTGQAAGSDSDSERDTPSPARRPSQSASEQQQAQSGQDGGANAAGGNGSGVAGQQLSNGGNSAASAAGSGPVAWAANDESNMENEVIDEEDEDDDDERDSFDEEDNVDHEQNEDDGQEVEEDEDIYDYSDDGANDNDSVAGSESGATPENTQRRRRHPLSRSPSDNSAAGGEGMRRLGNMDDGGGQSGGGGAEPLSNEDPRGAAGGNDGAADGAAAGQAPVAVAEDGRWCQSQTLPTGDEDTSNSAQSLSGPGRETQPNSTATAPRITWCHSQTPLNGHFTGCGTAPWLSSRQRQSQPSGATRGANANASAECDGNGNATGVGTGASTGEGGAAAGATSRRTWNLDVADRDAGNASGEGRGFGGSGRTDGTNRGARLHRSSARTGYSPMEYTPSNLIVLNQPLASGWSNAATATTGATGNATSAGGTMASSTQSPGVVAAANMGTNVHLARVFSAMLRLLSDLWPVLADYRARAPGGLPIVLTVTKEEVQNIKDVINRRLSATWTWLCTALDTTEAQLRYGSALTAAMGQQQVAAHMQHAAAWPAASAQHHSGAAAQDGPPPPPRHAARTVGVEPDVDQAPSGGQQPASNRQSSLQQAARAAKPDFVEYMLFTLRAQSGEHGDDLPNIDVSVLKPLSLIADALFHWTEVSVDAPRSADVQAAEQQAAARDSPQQQQQQPPQQAKPEGTAATADEHTWHAEGHGLSAVDLSPPLARRARRRCSSASGVDEHVNVFAAKRFFARSQSLYFPGLDSNSSSLAQAVREQVPLTAQPHLLQPDAPPDRLFGPVIVMRTRAEHLAFHEQSGNLTPTHLSLAPPAEADLNRANLRPPEKQPPVAPTSQQAAQTTGGDKMDTTQEGGDQQHSVIVQPHSGPPLPNERVFALISNMDDLGKVELSQNQIYMGRWKTILTIMAKLFGEELLTRSMHSVFSFMAGFGVREKRFRKQMERLRLGHSRDLVLQVDRDRHLLIQQTVKQLNQFFARYGPAADRHASALSSFSAHGLGFTSRSKEVQNHTAPIQKVKVTFKDEPGEGSGVARSFYAAIAEALLAPERIPSLAHCQANSTNVGSGAAVDRTAAYLQHQQRQSLWNRLRSSRLAAASQNQSGTGGGGAAQSGQSGSQQARRADGESTGAAAPAQDQDGQTDSAGYAEQLLNRVRTIVPPSMAERVTSMLVDGLPPLALQMAANTDQVLRAYVDDALEMIVTHHSQGAAAATSQAAAATADSSAQMAVKLGELDARLRSESSPNLHHLSAAALLDPDEVEDLRPLFFQPSANGNYAPVPGRLSAHRLDAFRNVGRIVGMCLLQNEVLPLPLCRHVFKFMLGRPINVFDLAFFDPVLFESLRHLATNRHHLDDLHLTFSIDLSEEEGGGTVELIRNGANTTVNGANVFEYMYRYCECRLRRLPLRPLQMLRLGLLEVVPQHALQPLTSEDLRLILCGTHEVDAYALYAYTTFSDESGASAETLEQYKRWFWALVFKMSNSQKQDLVYFWTGSPALPSSEEGFAPLPSVMLRPPDEHHLPTANTCISRLYLPLYSAKHALKVKLLQAIKARNFGFV